MVLEPTSQHYQVKTKSSLKNSLNEFGTSKAIDNEKQMGDLAMNIHEQGKDKNLEETSAWPAVNSSSQRCRFSPLLALNPFDDNFSCEMAILEGRIHSDTGQSENPEEHCELCTKTSYKSLSKAESCAVINSLRLSSCYSMPELHESELDPYLDIQETKTLSCNQIHPSDTTRSYVKDLECIWLLTSPSSFYPNGEPLTPPPKSPKRAVSLRSVSYRKDSLTLNIKDNAIRRRPSMIKQASPVHLSEKHFDADGLDDQFESEAGAGEIVFSTSQGPKRKGVLQKLNRFFRGKKNMDRSQRPNKKGRLRKLKRFFILKKDMDRSEETESLIEGKIKRKRFLLP